MTELQVVEKETQPITTLPGNTNSKASEKIQMARESTQVALAFQLAHSKPRFESGCRERILERCADISFAADAMYSLPKGGGEKVEGLSVKSAKEFMRIWGNVDAGYIDHGSYGDETQVEAFAHDLESNFRYSTRLTVSHKFKSGDSLKLATDPARIAELVKARASKEVRNCMLSILPDDLIEEAKVLVKQTIYREVGDVQEAWKGWIPMFAELSISPDSLLKYVNKPKADKLGADDIYRLRVMYTTLKQDPEAINEIFPFENEFKSSPNVVQIQKQIDNPVEPKEKKAVVTEMPGKSKRKSSAPAQSAAESVKTADTGSATTDLEAAERISANEDVSEDPKSESRQDQSPAESAEETKNNSTSADATTNPTSGASETRAESAGSVSTNSSPAENDSKSPPASEGGEKKRLKFWD